MNRFDLALDRSSSAPLLGPGYSSALPILYALKRPSVGAIGRVTVQVEM
jgi:hypothetical protein